MAQNTPHESPIPRATDPVVLAIHGGAGVLSSAEMAEYGHTRQDYERELARALAAGYAVLRNRLQQEPRDFAADNTTLDMVEAAIRVLEDCELFNAGRGGTFNTDGEIELDAAIMQGRMDPPDNPSTGHYPPADAMPWAGLGRRDPRKPAGAVAAVKHLKNPIAAARAVLEMPDRRHVLLVGAGAEAYVLREDVRARHGIERVENIYFWTPYRLKQIERYQQRLFAEHAPPSARFGTVGAVAAIGPGVLKDLDQEFAANAYSTTFGPSTVAAGTSTGGHTHKLPGRIGDSPLIGAGTYADDRACGVSCTGTGELFIRHVAAYDVAARMLYGGQDVPTAASGTIASLPDEAGGVGGLIALDPRGNCAFAMSALCPGMYRGYVTATGKIFTAIYRDEALARQE
ncbi:MAG: isoaspartyl peptidase/L-asparaginase [Pirellulales bacterium]|nr:isoaspartyl peptidase/L-asparaginase [Pirellulales bacterium]